MTFLILASRHGCKSDVHVKMKNPVVPPASRKTNVTQLVWIYSWCGCTNWKDGSANARMKVTEDILFTDKTMSVSVRQQ